MDITGIFIFIMMLLRFVLVLFAFSVIPITIFCVFRFFKRKTKTTVVKTLVFIIVSCLTVYIAFFPISGKQKVDIESLENTSKEFFELKNSYYEFDTGYITGNLSIYEIDGEHYYGPPYVDVIETGTVDSSVNYYLSKINYTKDERWYYLFSPSISDAVIVFNNNEKVIYIDYYYTDQNFSSVLWFFTNPELFYKQTIDFNDILSALQQSE